MASDDATQPTDGTEPPPPPYRRAHRWPGTRPPGARPGRPRPTNTRPAGTQRTIR